MVTRQEPMSSGPPPYPATPIEAASHARATTGSAHPQDTQHVGEGFTKLSLNDENEVEESSDWDASDHEENDTTKMVNDKPSAARAPMDQKRSQPRLTEEQIPGPLRLNKPGILDVTDSVHASSSEAPPAYMPPPSAIQPTTKSNTNPFRRPSDYKVAEPTADSMAVWDSEASKPAMLPPPSSYPVEQAVNPWKDDSREPFLASVPAHATAPVANPWAEEQKHNTAVPASANQHMAAADDNTYMADLIDLGPGQPTTALDNGTARQSQVTADFASPQPKSTLLGTTYPNPQPQPEQQPAEAPRPRPNQQRNETYQIKHIRWHDPKSKQSPRQSPILTQNANGPCPLLALVNALSLSTPPELHTALIETLRTREQVSLGLLLDAVFDELMSGRRGATAQALPDVGELYSFLVTLHTGMNVNPRFVPGDDGSTFEQTKEMLLYSTFDLPLVHGWIPGPQEPAFSAFQSTARSFEDAQNVQFQQEDLEQKLGKAVLSPKEQAVLHDLPIITQFLTSWPTQLTEHGLQTLKQGLPPGQIAILFRNDHFSTLFKEPKSGTLLTLVTDAGYSTHDEIVWESLADINGAQSELFSGDFRSVSHSDPQTSTSGDDGWTTVPNSRGHKQNVTAVSGMKTSQPGEGSSEPHTEQEDADLALALQLQEEEEQRERAEQAARRREERLSENYLDNESARRGPQIPPRGRRNQTQTGDELPSYEQAASERRYVPPRGHPSSEQTLVSTAPGAVSSQTQRLGMGRVPGQPMTGRRRARHSGATPFDTGSGHTSAEAVADRREGCMIM